MSALEKLGRSIEKRRQLTYARRRLAMRPHPLSFYSDKLAAGEAFSFSRFGDGEWDAIFRRPGANADAHEYFPELGARLAAALEARPPYYIGLQNHALKYDGRRIADWLNERAIRGPFHNADVFGFANVLGTLGPFIAHLRRRPVAMIGPPHLRGIDHVFPYERYFEVPAVNCFLEADTITRELRAFGAGRTGVVYAFSASMAANVMIHDLHPELGAENWLLDLGSIWDVYMGVRSRGWFRQLDLGPAMDRNRGVPPSRQPGRRLRELLVLASNRRHVRTD
ncbi:MAG: hypothetical protein ABI960_02750 [Candidatus Eisenbacteria bacterium]